MGSSTVFCPGCGSEYPLDADHFHRNRSSPRGYVSYCKRCYSERNRAKYARASKATELTSDGPQWKDGKLLCLTCHKHLDVSEFDIAGSNNRRQNKDRRCKSCKREQYRARKAAMSAAYGLYDCLRYRFYGARDRAKRKGISFSITLDDLSGMFESQKGLCALSGIPMTFKGYTGRVSTNVSVDRKDPHGGYSVDNVQLVCSAINQMKGDLTLEQLGVFCRGFLRTQKAPKQDKSSS